MLKKLTTLAVFAAAIGVAAATVYADTVNGRVTAFTPTSVSVFDKDVVTVAITADTTFSKLITRKPWQEDTPLTFAALRVGHYVVVHENAGVANWVEIATDFPIFAEATYTRFAPVVPVIVTEADRHRAEAAALRAAPTAAESKRPGAPGTALHCERLANEGVKAEPTPKGAPHNNRMQKAGK